MGKNRKRFLQYQKWDKSLHSHCMRKKLSEIQTGKEEMEVSLFGDDMIL